MNLEESLRRIVSQMTLGVGALPEAEPWRTIAKRARTLGIDIGLVTDSFWDVYYGGKRSMMETELIIRTVLLRSLGIALLMIGLRILLLRTAGVSDSPPAFDLPLIVLCSALSIWVLRVAIKALPRSWMWNADSESLSENFYAWTRMLMLGGISDQLSLTELEHSRSEHDVLRKAELRDGHCRESLRRRLTIEAGHHLNLRDREKLKRFSAVLPLIDLVLAGLLCIGFCGMPFLEWLMQSGVS